MGEAHVIAVTTGNEVANEPAPQAPPNVIQTDMGTQNPIDGSGVDKFGGDYDKLHASYKELEKKLGGGTPPATPGTPDVPTTPPAVLETHGTDTPFTPFEAEFAEKGELAAESYTKLESIGYPRAMVDQYIAGAKAQQEAESTEVLSVIGGKENFEAMRAWAEANYDDAQFDSFNAGVNSGDTALAKLAVRALKADYDGSKGIDPNLANGDGNAAGGVEPFESHAQVSEAMKDPRYEKDEAYRKEIAQRINASPKLMSSGRR